MAEADIRKGMPSVEPLQGEIDPSSRRPDEDIEDPNPK
jgi:hypothetical protein